MMVLLTCSPIFGPLLVRAYVQWDKEHAMKAGRCTEAQIITILREAETGQLTIEALCRKHAIGEATFYRWRTKYGGLEPSDAVRLKELARENARLNKVLAERDLEIEVMQEVNAKNGKRTRASATGTVRYAARVVESARVCAVPGCTLNVAVPESAPRT
jgi:putative transposase